MEKHNATKHILVVEDDQTYATIYKLKLEHAGYAITVAENGEEAIKYLEKNKPDLVILDLILPIMDGFEVLRRMRVHPDWKDIKVIVLSVLGQEEDKARIHALGVEGYFVKSKVSIMEVVDAIKKVLV